MKQNIFLRLTPFFFLVFLSLTLLSNSSNGKTQNIKMVETYWEEVWGKGNLQAVANFYHPNAKHLDSFTIEGFQKGVVFFREAYPDFKVIINDIFATGNKVICEVTYIGTHTGRKIYGQDPLGKAIKVRGMDIFTFKDGKCVNHQHVADHLDLVKQMGIKLTPTPPDKKD